MEISVLQPCTYHAKSVFVQLQQRIEQDSIYDHTENYNKTRFTSNLPQKFSKTSKPYSIDPI
jgi:hypothetical protein